MSQDTVNLTVLGLNIAFRAGADMERVQRAADLVEERFAEQKQRFQSGQSKDVLLTFMALGLADDLLQAQSDLAEVSSRVGAVLSTIEESL